MTTPASTDQPAPNPLAAAARGVHRGRPPVWLMRQAGRYLPGYQALRSQHSFARMCADPDLACQVSLEPYRLFALDAVIVFYDILFLAEAMGAPVEYTERGPVFRRPVRDLGDVRRLRLPDPGQGTGAVLETLRRLRAELPPEVAVLGFAGAPFTVAAYLVEGDFRKSGEGVRKLIHIEPGTLHELLDLLSRATRSYLEAQVEAGATAVQLFDTWAGHLSGPDYEAFALPYARAALEGAARRGAPTILYLNGCAHLLERLARSGADVLSIDWRVSLAEARRRLGPRPALQGNLDPAALFAPPAGVRLKAREMLSAVAGDPGYISNLGHGVLPGTPVDSVRAFVEAVREWSPEAG